MKQRIHWVDVAKCFGMFAIYLGHFNMSAGYARDFVFTYHVPLFFFLSGCMENYGRETGIRETVKKVFKTILVPWLFFCVVSVVMYALENNSQILDMWPMIWRIAEGTLRNTYFAVGLWFLTCLASTRLLFAVIRKLRFKILILAACVAAYAVALRYVNIEEPRIPFNADCALYYLLYYGLGYVTFPYIARILEAETLWQKGLFACSFCVTAGYCAYLFFGRNLLGFLEGSSMGQILYPILTALLGIWFQFCLAKICSNVEAFRTIGKNTLYLCGSEYLIRTLVSCGCGMVGLHFTQPTPLAAWIWSAVLIWLANRYLVPLEKRILDSVLTPAGSLLKKTKV